jgi:hypothetical protein
MSLRCPRCGCSKLIDSSGPGVRGRRMCDECDYEWFPTPEVPEIWCRCETPVIEAGSVLCAECGGVVPNQS